MPKVAYPKITLKFFTKKLLEKTSKSVKLKEKVIMDLVFDMYKDYTLVLPRKLFSLHEDEAFFEIERMNGKKIHGNKGINVRISADSKIVSKELSENTGIPIWWLADYGLRLAIKYECLSGSNKWRKRIRDAIKRQSSLNNKLNNEIQLKKIDFETRARVQSDNRILGLDDGPRVIAKSRRAREKRKTKLMLHEIVDYRSAIRHLLKNQYRWDSYNHKEIEAFMEGVLLNRNPVPVEFIRSKEPLTTINEKSYGTVEERKSLYSLLSNGVRVGLNKLGERGYTKKKMEWIIPECFDWLDIIVKVHKLSYKEIKDMEFSIKDWYEYVGLPLSNEYEQVKHERIETRQELNRIGIAEALDLKIKDVLKILDLLEYAYVNFEELDAEEKVYLRLKVYGSERDHEYAELIREKLERDKGSQPPQE